MNTSWTTIQLLRYSVAFVFITSGLMKFTSDELGHVFINLGLPYPIQMMYGLALIEMVCGVLIMMNKHTKNAVIPLIGVMIAALVMTKLPVLSTGLIPTLFHARLDVVMLILLFILYRRP